MSKITIDLTPIFAGFAGGLWLHSFWFGVLVVAVFSSFGRNPVWGSEKIQKENGDNK